MTYPSSTQARFWTFTEEELATRRLNAIQKSLESVRRAMPQADGITPQEQSLLLRFYEFKIQETCDRMGFPLRVQATAIVFFKRFYLMFSVMDYDPKIVMLTCVYVSCKIEENYIDAEFFGQSIKQDHTSILELEVTVMEALHFQFSVFHPYRALNGFISDMQDHYPPASSINLVEFRAAAAGFVHLAMTTDAVLVHPPSQIALACMGMAATHYPALQFESYVQGRFAESSLDQEVHQALSKISAVVTAYIGKVDLKKEATAIFRKMKHCINPDTQQQRGEKDSDAKQAKLQERAAKTRRELQELTGMPAPQ